jgi:hypothetical protein
MRAVEVTEQVTSVTDETGHRDDCVTRRPSAHYGSYRGRRAVTTLEEIIYDAGRAALADQEATVAGIRQRTGTLLAAQALVASFLGSSALRADGFSGWNRPATIALVAGLILAAALLAPWRMGFAVDARELYERLYAEATDDAREGRRGWLISAAFIYQDMRHKNEDREELMRRLSTTLGVVTVAQTLFWLLALGLD